MIVRFHWAVSSQVPQAWQHAPWLVSTHRTECLLLKCSIIIPSRHADYLLFYWTWSQACGIGVERAGSPIAPLMIRGAVYYHHCFRPLASTFVGSSVVPARWGDDQLAQCELAPSCLWLPLSIVIRTLKTKCFCRQNQTCWTKNIKLSIKRIVAFFSLRHSVLSYLV